MWRITKVCSLVIERLADSAALPPIPFKNANCRVFCAITAQSTIDC